MQPITLNIPIEGTPLALMTVASANDTAITVVFLSDF